MIVVSACHHSLVAAPEAVVVGIASAVGVAGNPWNVAPCCTEAWLLVAPRQACRQWGL